MSFYRPFKFRFCNIAITKSNSQRYINIGCQLLELFLSLENGTRYLSTSKLLPQLSEIFAQVDKYSGISTNDAVLSRRRLDSTASIGYLRFIGVFSSCLLYTSVFPVSAGGDVAGKSAYLARFWGKRWLKVLRLVIYSARSQQVCSLWPADALRILVSSFKNFCELAVAVEFAASGHTTTETKLYNCIFHHVFQQPPYSKKFSDNFFYI